MEKNKEKRRTIGAVQSPISKPLHTTRSNNSISSFFFGQSKVPVSVSPKANSSSPRNSTSAKHHSGSQKALGLVEAGKARMGLLRENSNASASSAASRATASSKGSAREGSPVPRPLSVRVTSSNDEQDRVESKAMSVSMKLGMWEGGSVAGDSSRAGTPTHHSSKGSGKRGLNRDNSVGSTFSNVSNISNSNISVLSHSSNGSQKSSSFRDNEAPAPAFNPAAAAAANRQRYLATTVQHGPYVLNTNSQSMDAYQEEKGVDRPVPSQRRDDSLRSTASMELQAASSSENSPVTTPRLAATDNTEAAETQDTAGAPSATSMECDAKDEPHNAAPAARPSLLSAAREVVVVQSALKKIRRSMSPLPNTREGVERARSSWMQSSVAAVEKDAQGRPRMVKFTSSTRSMGELRTKKEQQKQAAEAAASADGAPSEKGVPTEEDGAPSTEEDVLVLEGVTMVDETEESGAEAVQEEKAAASEAAAHPPPQKGSAPSDAKANAVPALRRAAVVAPAAAELSPKRSEGVLSVPLPKLTHVEPEPHPFTPVKPEFLEVKLKSTPSSAAMVVTPPATPSAAQTAARTPASQKKASLQDPRVPLAELLRINAQKAYGELVSGELEVYLDDAEFAKAFRVTRQVFYEMPLWRQHNQKRAVGLF